MRLLIDFLCRFGWGLCVGLLATPAAAVPAGFFRVNLLVVMGLATFAALVAGSVADGGPWPALAAAACLAWAAGVAWLAEKRRAGIALCAASGLLLAVATWSVAAEPWAALVSGLVTGLTVHAMLLGHWYLNAPGMKVDILRRAIDVAIAAWGLRLLLAVIEQGPRAATLVGGADATTLALLALRWLAGLVGLPVLLVMSRKTLEIPNTQSATGILYVACLAAILGELTAQLLSATP